MMEMYTSCELASIFGIADRNIRKKAIRQNWPYKITESKNGKLKQYHISALPPDIQAKIRAAESEKAIQAAQPQLELALATVATMTATQLTRAEAREIIVKEYRRTEKSTTIALFCENYNNNILFNGHLIHHLIPTISPKSVYNWDKAYKDAGIAGLADNYGGRKGQTIIEKNTEIKKFILAMLASHPHANAKHIISGLRKRFERSALPSYRTLQRWLWQWKNDNKQVLTAMINPDKWRNIYQASAGSYSENIVRLNQMWEFDSTPTDILLKDGSRHTIIGAIDVYSRRVKLLVTRTSSSKGVAALIRNCLLDWGVPELVKTDNGADYASKHISRVFDGLEIAREFCRPFTPNAKPHIERVFRTFSHDLLELCPGYIGHNVAERKDIEARHSFADHIGGKAKWDMTINMTVDELQAFCDKWANNVYAHNLHAGLKDKTPFEMVTNFSGKVRRIENERALDILLSETAGDGIRVVTKKGIRIDGDAYDSADLAGYEGKQVKVLFDESNYAQVYVFEVDGKFLCKATCPERAGVSRAEVANHRREKQKKLISAQKKVMNDLKKEYNTDNIALEILEGRAQETGKLMSMPRPAESYTTKFLAEAESILKKPMREARRLSVQEQAILDGMASGKIKQVVRDTPEQKIERWESLAARLRQGETLSQEDMDFYEVYQLSTEFKTAAVLREVTRKCG